MKINEEQKSPNRYSAMRPIFWLLSPLDKPRKFIRRLYGWVIGWSEKKQAEKALAGIAFAESSFFPVPPDPLLIAIVTAKPKKFLRVALICTIFSILGGLLGYLIGAGLFEVIGKWIVNTYGLQDEFNAIQLRYENNAFLTIFTAAFTPIPYKLITISAGVFKVNFWHFIVASIVGRGMRFFSVATVAHYFGAKYKAQIEKYIDILSLLFVAIVVLGIFATKLL